MGADSDLAAHWIPNRYLCGACLYLHSVQMKIKFSSIVLVLILLYGINYFIFERVFFFNELISLLGFLLFLRTSFLRPWRFRIPHSLIYKLVLVFIGVGLLHAVIGLFIKTNWYYYFRNLSILYSVFGFFLGFYLYHEQFHFYRRLRGLIYGYGLLAFSTGKFGLIDRSSFTFWLALIQRRWNLLPVLLLMAVLGLYLLAYTSLTVFISGAAILAFLSIRRYSSFVFLSFIGATAIVVIFVLAIPYLRTYSVNPDLFFGDVVYVYNQHPWFNLDHNSSWRMILWYRTLVEAFPQNLLGLGLGTPLLPYHPNVTTTDLGHPDEYIAHVIGAHNTFVTVYARLGLLSIIPLVAIYHRSLKEFFVHKAYYLTNRNDGGVFFGFITITIVGFFNLLIETPTLASLYWVSMGFMARAIYARQFENREVQDL